jgi:hypothetical protein
MAPTTRRGAHNNATNLLTATPDEAALIIACALADPKDLLRLARACRRFAIKCIATPASHRTTASGSAAAAAQQAELWSIVEEVARRWIATCTEQERGWVPRRGRESWLGLMWEVQALRRGAVFGRSHEWVTLSEGGALATFGGQSGSHRAAASNVVMRAGRHYVQFTVMMGFGFYGAIRPGWNVRGWGVNAYAVDGHCFCDTDTGMRYPGHRNWKGRQHPVEGDRIGLLLDLDQGTMTVYKNDERLGVMATGLSGEYCWAVSLYEQQWQWPDSTDRDTVRIEAAVAPPCPSVEELAQSRV